VAHCFLFILRRPLTSTLFPYTTLFRSVRFVPARPLPDTGPAQQVDTAGGRQATAPGTHPDPAESRLPCPDQRVVSRQHARLPARSEEHTSELQSRFDLVCRLLLEKKKN